ncbi:MAG: GspMb/PilO family protein [Acidobacteriota bacterium]|nr:GspMb/PilO family protein [Acidobacteriota bacterium]
MTPNDSPGINQSEEVIVQDEEATVVTASGGAPIEKRKPRILVRKRGGMFDVPEIAAVSVGGFLLLMVLVTYLFWLKPAQAQLKQREATRSNLEAEHQRLKNTLGEDQTTEGKVAEIIGSLERFEVNFLSPPMQGNASLFGRLNEIIRNNNLRNTAGPDYAPLETVALDKYDPTKIAEAKNQNLYPGTAVSVTVEGGYANLRRFISELENSRQFIVVRAIEIEAENTNSSSGGAGGSQPAADLNTVRSSPQTSGIPSQVSGIPAPGSSARPNSVNPRGPQIPPGMAPPPTQQQSVAPRPTAPSASRGSVVSMRVDLVSYFRRNGDAQPARGAQNQ